MDAYVKTVLTVIAACLLLQVAQGFGVAGRSGQVISSSSESAERYTIQPIPMVRLLLRFDRVTGQTWAMPLQPNKEKFWTPIVEAPPGAAVSDQAEDSPSQREEAGGAEQ